MLMTFYIDCMVQARCLGKVYLGSFMYADDLVVTASSLTILQKVQKVTRIYELFQLTEIICCWERPIAYVSVCGAAKHCKMSYSESLAKFYQSLNRLLYKSKHFKNEVVLLELINCFCEPYLLYALECIELSATYINIWQRSLNRVFWKLFHNEKCNLFTVQHYMNILFVKHEIDVRRMNFLCKLQTVQNSVLNQLFETCTWQALCGLTVCKIYLLWQCNYN